MIEENTRNVEPNCQKMASRKDQPSDIRAATDAAILDTLITALRSGPSENQAQPGQTFGSWTLISSRYHQRNSKEPLFLLRCQCGTLQVQPQSLILTGKSTSCKSCSPQLQ